LKERHAVDTNIPTLESLIETVKLVDSFYLIMGAGGVALWVLLSKRRRLKLPRITPLTIILILALIIRLNPMSDSFWYDETFSAAFAQLPFADLGRAIVADVHPPLYYWILWHIENILGASEWALRLPALTFGVGSVWMMYHVTFALTKHKQTALIASAILAFMPMNIRYSVEARAYSLMVLVVLIGLLGSLKKRSIPFVFALAVMPLLHNHGYIYAGMLGAGGIYQHRKRWLPITLLGGVTGALWLPVMLYQSQTVANGFWMIPFHPISLLSPLNDMSIGRGYNMHLDMLITGGVFALTFAGFKYFRQANQKTFVAWALVAVGVPFVAGVASLVWTPVYLHRALLPAVMLFVPLWAMVAYHSRAGRWVLVATLTLSMIGYITLNDRRNDDVRTWLDCEGDVIYTLSTSMAIQALYYNNGRDVYVSPTSNDQTQKLPADVLEAMGLIISDWDDLPSGTVCIPHQIGIYTAVHDELLDTILSNPHTSELKYDNEYAMTYAFEVMKDD
jgi:hypothetical protein